MSQSKDHASSVPEPCGWMVERSRKLVKEFDCAAITFDEFVSEFATTTVDRSDECMRRCIQAIPAELLRRLAKHSWVSSGDESFLPSPRMFLAGPVTEQQVETLRRKLAPRYARIRRLIVDRAEQVGAGPDE